MGLKSYFDNLFPHLQNGANDIHPPSSGEA